MRDEWDHTDSPAEPVPWASGVLVGVLAALVEVGVVLGVYDVVAQNHRWLGMGAVAVVCAGVVPTAWAWRRRPVLRWLSWGVLVGAALSVAATVIIVGAGMR